MARWNPGDSQGSGNALCDTVTVDTGRSILSKPTECTTPRLTPNVHCRYWVMVTDVPLCWGVLLVEETACAGGRGTQELCAFLSIAVSLKLF